MTEIAMYRGDDATFPFTLTQGGVAVDLTGATVVFSARLRADFDEDEAAPLIVESPDVTILPDQATTGKGKITVHVTDTASAELETGLYLCDVQVTLGGLVWTWPEPVYGQSTLIRLRIKPDVTHA